ncbi:MAG TPA: SDR family oxidoreductase [Bryobacteraceae bacterium]|nr:SDR family oxidoreductase [Bryobacteraceae bacterium]
MNLTGKVAIVTGGAAGIGLGIARVLAFHGVKLVLVERSRADFSAQAAAALAATEVVAHVVDISARDAVFRMVEQVEQRFGRIDILVNHTSVSNKDTTFLDTTEEQVQRIVDAGVKGTFYCSQAVARSMVAKGIPGAIIHISSAGAFAAQECASLDCATRAAYVSLAKSMALELAPHGIRVNCIAPGEIQAADGAAPASSRFLRATPLGRKGTPEEIGFAVAFLVSDEASFITGTTLLIDGGLLSY